MNKTYVVDKLFNIWTKLPFCAFNRQKYIRDIRDRFDYKNNSDISIIATNCIGGEIYYLLGLQFKSPLINISINRKQFIELCTHLKDYFSMNLRVERDFRGGVLGILGDGDNLPLIEIRFPHDINPTEVLANWRRRCQRVNYDKLVLICDDKDGISDKELSKYNNIQAYRKILFTAKNMNTKYSWCYYMKAYKNCSNTGKYNGKTINGLWKFTEMWDYVSFLNGVK